VKTDALRQFDDTFWSYLASFSLLSFSIVIFGALYPLFLDEHVGKAVSIMGNATLATNLGCVAGAVPAVMLMRRFGLKGAHIVAIVGINVAMALRLFYDSVFMTYGFAFVAGFFLSVLAVGIPVIVARITSRGNRVLAFSCFFVATIGASVVAMAIAGEMPGVLDAMDHGHHHGERLLTALLFGCAIGITAVVPAVSMNIERRGVEQRLRIPRGRRAHGLITAIALWNFAVGLFAPFFTLYFSSHLGASMRVIGLKLAAGQLIGAVFMVFAPMWVARWGMVRSIRFFMFGAGAAAFFMTLTEQHLASGIGYAIYMGYVAMVQPPVDTLLMDAVHPEDRAGASMTNSLFGFIAVAAGGFTGAQLIDALGYPEMLALAGTACMAAAVAFVVLVRPDGAAAVDSAHQRDG